MFLIKKINAIGIIHLTEDNKELGCEAWNLSSSGIKKALELFLKTPHCLFVISSGWKDHLANRKVLIRKTLDKIDLVVFKKGI